MWPDICWRIQPEPEVDSVTAALLLDVLMMCVKLCNLCINCNLSCVVIANCNA